MFCLAITMSIIMIGLLREELHMLKVCPKIWLSLGRWNIPGSITARTGCDPSKYLNNIIHQNKPQTDSVDRSVYHHTCLFIVRKHKTRILSCDPIEFALTRICVRSFSWPRDQRILGPSTLDIMVSLSYVPYIECSMYHIFRNRAPRPRNRGPWASVITTCLQRMQTGMVVYRLYTTQYCPRAAVKASTAVFSLHFHDLFPEQSFLSSP